MKTRYLIVLAAFLAVDATAGSSTLDAAIGGGLGGAAGAAIGNELGGRDGAILGGAVGAAVGTAVNTDKEKHRVPPPEPVYYERQPRRGGPPGCPPGLRKQGRCD